VATIVDVRTRRIPNELTAAMAVTGLGLAATGMSGVPLLGSAIGLALGFALMLPGHVFGGTGAGDVKLMAAIGAIVGPATVVTAFFFTAIAGGVLAIVVAAQRRRLGTTLAGTGKLIAAPIGGTHGAVEPIAARRFAYGPAIAIGSVLAAIVG
jgi:prepilin peptidase CpaA